MSAPKSINRRSMLKTAGASTVSISIPISGALTGSQPRPEFVELFRECISAGRNLRDAERRAAVCFRNVLDTLHQRSRDDKRYWHRDLNHEDLAIRTAAEMGVLFRNASEVRDILYVETGYKKAKEQSEACLERYRALIEHVMEARASNVEETALKVAVARASKITLPNRTFFQKEEFINSVTSDLQAIGIMPDWEVAA